MTCKGILVRIWNVASRCQRVLRALVVTIPRIAGEAQLLKGLRRKSCSQRYWDLLRLYIRDHEVNVEYNAMGIDHVGENPFDYVRRGFDQDRRVGRWTHTCPNDGYAVLSNKYLFWLYARSAGLSVVPVLAKMSRTAGHSINDRPVSEIEFEEYLSGLSSFFLKPEEGCCGSRCRIVKRVGEKFLSDGSEIDLRDLISSGDFIVQPAIKQDSSMNAFNPDSINTIRIVTCRRNGDAGEPELFCQPVLRIGRKGSCVDNFTAGGFAVGIDESGKLKQIAYTHDRSFRYCVFERHPDWDYAFHGKAVPQYEAAVALALHAHRLFPRLRSVGWDVAISDSGPVIVEGNPSWGVTIMQVAHQCPMWLRLREIGMGDR